LARAQQPQAVQNHEHGAAFVTDDARGEIYFFQERGNDEEQNHAERDGDVLANHDPRAPAQAEGLFDVLDLVVHQNDVRLLQRRIGAARAHSDRDVGGGEARRVVDPVADHGHFFSRRAPIVNALVSPAESTRRRWEPRHAQILVFSFAPH
jgi:hypothetical protein